MWGRGALVAFVGPSGGQLLLRLFLLNGLTHLFSSSGSGFHTSRAVAEFHVSDFGHCDYFIAVVYFLPRQVKVLTLARRASLNAESKELSLRAAFF
jgi:hypothetical protein